MKLERGINLGGYLSQCVHSTEHYGHSTEIKGCERWRKSEAARMLAAMEGLKRLFGGSHPLKKLVRGVGLRAVDGLAPLKQSVIRAAMGLDGELPALAKGEKI